MPSQCAHCRQPVEPGAAACRWCGAVQIPADGPAGQAPTATSAPTTPGASAPRQVGPLPASVGARLAAFTLDAAVVAVIAGGVWWGTRSVPLAAVVGLEAGVALAVLEARTGLTAGNAVLRIRSTRIGTAYSPGVGRLSVRNAVTGVGFLAAIVGAWVVVASAAWDPERRGRTWADLIAKTAAVAVPGPSNRAPGPMAPAAIRAVPTPHGTVVPLAVAAPVPVPVASAAPLPPEPARSASTRSASGQAPADAVAAGSLLVVFDTGQRVQLPAPCSAVLGRRPEAVADDDHVIVVDDPSRRVSKSHLRLEYVRGTTWVTDLGSANGSRLVADDGRITALEPQVRARVDDGTRIGMGDRAFSISLVNDDSSEGSPA